MQGRDTRISQQTMARGVRSFIVAMAVSLVASCLAIVTSPAERASAAGAATITKALDATQGAGFDGSTTPATFQTGSLVRYRLRYQCSSLTEPCVTGTITDVIDLNLEFVEVIPPSSNQVIVASSFDAGTRTLTVNLSSFDDNDSGDIVVVTRVRSSTPAGAIIPNQATIQVPGGPVVASEVVHIQVPAATPNWNLGKSVNGGQTSFAPGSTVTYRVGFMGVTSLGNVSVASATVVDTYPAGAVVIDAAGGVVDPVAHTITWSVGPVTVGAEFNRLVTLQFPADIFPVGSSPVNHSAVAWTFADGSTGSDTAQVGISIVALSPDVWLTKSVAPTTVSGNEATFTVTWRNRGNVALSNVIIEDVLPAGITALKLGRTGEWPAAAMSFEARVGGVWQVFASRTASNPSWVPEGASLNLPTGTTAIRIVVTGTLEPGAQFGFGLHTRIDAAPGEVVTNCVSSSGSLPGGGVYSATDGCASTTVAEPFARLRARKSVPRYNDVASTSTRPGDEFIWSLATYLDAGSNVSSLTVADLLPAQLEYVGEVCAGLSSAYFIQYESDLSGFPCGTQRVADPVVTAVGGRQLVTWNVDLATTPLSSAWSGPTLYTALSTERDQTQALVINFRVRVKPGTAVGSYVNEMSTSTNEYPATCTSGGTADVGDRDGDGDVTDLRCEANNTFIVDEAAVVAGDKWDDGYPGLEHVRQDTGQPSADCPDWDGYTRYPCVAQTIPTGSFSYKWRLENIGNVDLTNYVAYDVLPFVGDTGVSQLLSGESRGTSWRPMLTGPVVVESEPVGAHVVIEYNLTSNPCRPELNQGAADGVWQAGCDDVWYSAAQISDWSSVRSFRLRAFEQVGGVWPAWSPLDQIVLNAPMAAPAGAPTSTSSPLNLSIAWNSFATRAYRLNRSTQATQRLLASEPRKVGIIIPFVENLPDQVRIGNQVWLDTGAGNHRDNGVYDVGESPISGVAVELWNDVDGDGVFEPAGDDSSGRVGVTTTDANGNYWFLAIADTPYFVAIPSGQTGQNGGALDLSDTSSSSGQGIGSTDNDDNGAPTAGYASVSRVVRVAVGGAPTGEQDTNDAVSAETEADAATSSFTDNNSDLTIDFGFVLPEDTVYRLGNLVWFDWNNNGIAEASEAGVAGVTVQLLDSTGAVFATATTDANGHYLFSDLPAGDYRVRIPSGQTVLNGLTSSTNGEESNPNLDVDNNDNGITVDAAGVTSGVVTLGPAGSEPTNEVFRNGSSTDDDNDSFPDADSNLTVDFGFTAVRLGNQVWLDNGAGAHFDNGVYDTDETPISGVTVQLWHDDGDGVFEPGAGDTVAGTTTTDGDGNYWFLAQPDVQYFVAIPGGQSVLAGLVSSTGVATGSIDNDDNGAPSGTYASVSGVRAVTPGGAPAGEIDTNDTVTAESEANTATRLLPDANSDLTIDFGFRPVGYDLALIKTRVTASPVQPGANVTWSVTVVNQGAEPSGAYTLTDTLPTGIGFVSASDGGTHAGGVVTWNLTGLEPGQSRVLTLVSRVDDVSLAPYRNWAEISSDSGDDADSTPDTNTGSDTTAGTGTAPNDQVTNHNSTTFDNNTETPLPGGAVDEDDNDYEDVDVAIVYDLALAKVTTSGAVEVGASVTWTVRVQNQGNVASGVYTVTDRIPTGMTFVSCAGATSCSNASGVVTVTMPSLAPGAFADFTLVTQVSDMNFQPFRNWAEISADGADAYDIAGVRDVEDKDSTPDTNTGSDTAYGPAMAAIDNGGSNDTYVGITDLGVIATDGQPASDEDDNDDAIVAGVVHYDLALIKTASASSVAPSGSITWTITVKNQGNVDSRAFGVTDTLPGGMTYVSSTPAGAVVTGSAVTGQTVTWTGLANLAPGARTTLTITTTATDMTKKPFRNWAEISADGADNYDLPGLDVEDEDSIPDTNTGSDTGVGTGTPPNDLVVNHNDVDVDQPIGDEDDNDYEEVSGDVEYDLALVKVVDNVSPVLPTDTITWRIRVRNQGNVASGVYTVTDSIPTGLTFETCTGGTSCVESAGVITWTMPNLAVGAEADISYTTTIADVNEAPFRNWAEISSDSAQDLYDVDDVDSTPDTNTGRDQVLPNDDYVGITDLADVTIDQVAGDEDDNDDASVDVSIVYDLALAKVTPVATVNPTDQVSWTIRVVNQGNVPSGEYSVTDTLPTGMVFVNASNGGTATGGIVTWTLPSLAPGAHVDVTLTTSISDPSQRPFRNWAEISADSADTYDIPGVRDVEDKDSIPDTITGHDDTLPNEDYVPVDDLPVISSDGAPGGDEDDNDDAIVDISVDYDLALIKTVQTGPFTVGANVTWTITVANQGNVPSGLYTVTDTIPGGLAFVSANPAAVTVDGHIVWSDLPSLAPGETTQLTLVTSIDDGTKRPFRNWAEISADSADTYSTPTDTVTDDDSTPDSDTGSDTGNGTGTPPNDHVVNHNDITIDEPVGDEDDNDFEDIDITVIYDLALVKSLPAGQTYRIGDDVTFLITIKNQGNVPSGTYTIQDVVPTGLRYVSSTLGGTANGQVVSWTLPSLAPGDKQVVTIVVRLTDATQPSYINYAEITSDSAANYDTPEHTVSDKDSAPDFDIANDPLVDTDDVDTDQIPGDEDDHDRALISVTDITTANPPNQLPRTGTEAGPLVGLAVISLAVGLFLSNLSRRRRRFVG